VKAFATKNGDAVHGESWNTGTGVVGRALGSGRAIQGLAGTSNFAAIEGINQQGIGVWGESKGNGDGVHGQSDGTGAAVAGIVTGSGLAGFFQGDVKVTGDVILVNQDCAEEFDLSTTDTVEPGTVMVLNQSGNLEQSNQAYDKKVAGIVSGAGGCKPGIVLGRQESESKRVPIALMGKAYCKVDATFSPIEIGDVLTTSSTKGHAMKAEDPFMAFGAVIGKALGSIKEGFGIIPVLVALQ
jgi:hypothetical protein